MNDVENQKTEYIRSFIKSPFRMIEEIERNNNLRNDVQPQIEPEVGRFLETMVITLSARRILELGTSNGSSALWIISALKKTNGQLITIDSKERLYNEAIANFKRAEVSQYVRPIFGDAEVEVEKLDSGFDLIFQDCGKYLYPRLFYKLVDLLRPGGMIIADDTLFKVNPGVRQNLGRFTDDYNQLAFSCEKLTTAIIPIGCGLTMSIKL